MDRVELYDLVHRGTPGDQAFYQEVCRDAVRVLELGCGTGRILRGLLAPERSVTGLDIDLDRLDVARTTAPGSSLVLGDMGSFVIPERFERILIPYNGLFALTSEAHILACLERVRVHLVPGGELFLDVYVVDDETEHRLRSTVAFEPLTTVVHDGRSIQVWERMAAGAGPETIEATYRFLGEGEETVDVIRHKYLRPDRLVTLVEEAGLGMVGRWSDFQGTPFDETGELMVLRAVAPGEAA